VTVEAPTAAPPAVDPQVEIRAVLEEYRTAIESVDIVRVKSVYPDMSTDQERAWREFFRNESDLTATFRIIDLDVRDNEAVARVQTSYVYRTDRARPLTGTFTARLERGTRGWQLVSIN
jgi:hypothetical protein